MRGITDKVKCVKRQSEKYLRLGGMQTNVEIRTVEDKVMKSDREERRRKEETKEGDAFIEKLEQVREAGAFLLGVNRCVAPAFLGV